MWAANQHDEAGPPPAERLGGLTRQAVCRYFLNPTVPFLPAREVGSPEEG